MKNEVFAPAPEEVVNGDAFMRAEWARFAKALGPIPAASEDDSEDDSED